MLQRVARFLVGHVHKVFFRHFPLLRCWHQDRYPAVKPCRNYMLTSKGITRKKRRNKLCRVSFVGQQVRRLMVLIIRYQGCCLSCFLYRAKVFIFYVCRRMRLCSFLSPVFALLLSFYLVLDFIQKRR